MTDRELRLRQRIDVLTDQLDHAVTAYERLRTIRVPDGKRLNFCAYCGRHCRGLACHAHSDLIDLDPLAPTAEPELIYQ